MAISYGVFQVAPKFCVLSSFLLYVLAGNTLDAEKVYAIFIHVSLGAYLEKSSVLSLKMTSPPKIPL
jgi:hypothetical protein